MSICKSLWSDKLVYHKRGSVEGKNRSPEMFQVNIKNCSPEIFQASIIELTIFLCKCQCLSMVTKFNLFPSVLTVSLYGSVYAVKSPSPIEI